jgi:hypothetical protein
VGNTTWRSELTSVEKLGDDLCGGLKVSSNVEIARSLRKYLRVYVEVVGTGGRATESERGPTRLPFALGVCQMVVIVLMNKAEWLRW